MDKLTSPRVVAELLARHGLYPKKKWGQNFLVDQNILDKLVAAVEPTPQDLVLEIGPGLGTLTRALAERCREVVAVEVDQTLAPVLEETLGDLPNARVVFQDILDLSPSEVWPGNLSFKIAGNLPYYITSPILARFLESDLPWTTFTCLVQWEVAERLRAVPGGKEYGSLSILVQYHTRVEVPARVPRGVFFPRPDVDSAIVKLTRTSPPAGVQNETLFFAAVRRSFQQRRKTLLNSLEGLALGNRVWGREKIREALVKAGIDPGVRGETLGLEEFARLTSALNEV